jgi:hypothetical protein
MAEDFEVALVIEAGNGAIGAGQGSDVIDLQPQLSAGVAQAGFGVFSDRRRLEAASFAGPAGTSAGSTASGHPDVVALELQCVPIAAEGGAPGWELSAAGRETAELLSEVDAGDVGVPGGRHWRGDHS